MQVVRHYDVAANKVAFAFEVIEPLVHQVVPVSEFKKGLPLLAGKGDKEDPIPLVDVLADAHIRKIKRKGCTPKQQLIEG
jgi:hypothetical protein